MSPSINSKHLAIIAVLETLVMSSVLIRFALPGFGVDFSAPLQLAWLIATFFLNSTAVAHFVLRSSMLKKKLERGEDVGEERQHILVVSIAIVVGAALLSLAGPASFQQMFG